MRHYEEVARATDQPVLLYNIPPRTAVDMPNDLLAELAQIEHIDGVKQANPDNLRSIDGLDVYAGNDDMLARRARARRRRRHPASASHIVGDEMRRMVDEPERRREIDADRCATSTRRCAVDHEPDPREGGAEPARPRGRRPAAAARRGDRRGGRRGPRACSTATGSSPRTTA